ncbi:unnamed protein product [Boreogadus saida]
MVVSSKHQDIVRILGAATDLVVRLGGQALTEVLLSGRVEEPRLEVVVVVGGEERAEVTEEGEGGRRGSTEKRRRERREGEDASGGDQPETHASKKLRLWYQNPEPHPKTKQNPVHPQRPPEPGRDPQPGGPEDLCESMSTQSDNQSALSSLSSQSPPTSPPVAAPPAEPCPPPAPRMPPARPDHLDLSLRGSAEGLGQSQEGEGDDPLDQSAEGGEEELGDGWMPRAWPEGRQVNRSSLLVREPPDPPPEANGTNGKEEFPVKEAVPPAGPSMDEEEEEEEEEGGGGGDADEIETGPRTGLCSTVSSAGREASPSFMRSKRFCSTSCARGFNVRLTSACGL